MSVTVASITTLSAFSTVDTADVQDAIDRAERRTNRDAWASKADDGVRALACHLLTIAQRVALTGARARGAVISQSVGPVSRTYAAPMANSLTEQALASTAYGQEYLSLRSEIFTDRIVL